MSYYLRVHIIITLLQYPYIPMNKNYDNRFEVKIDWFLTVIIFKSHD